MTKQEIYAELKVAGIDVPDYKKATKEQLETILNDIKRVDTIKIVKSPVVVEKPVEKQTNGKPPMLYFPGSGWCEALHCSYFMGYYKPATWEEYEALKPFARGANFND